MALSFWQGIAQRVFPVRSRSRSRPRRPARLSRCRLTLTILEDRTLPSTLTVTNLLDSGDGSLRDQVAASADGDTIVFDNSLRGTITLTSGELDIPHALTIQGPGADIVTVSGNNTQRVFHVEPNAAATITNLTIANGRVVADLGAGIDSEGSLTLRNSILRNNTARMGAGVAFVAHNTGSASLTVSGCTFTNNTGFINGAAIFSSVSDRSGVGNVTITDSNFTNNIVGGDGGAIDGLTTLSGTASAAFTITGGTFSSNRAASGGAIALTVRTADVSQGTVTLSGATVQRNGAVDGGGISIQVTSLDTSQATATLSNSTIESNRADEFGGGLYSAVTSSDSGQAALAVTGSTSARLDANIAQNGAGIYSTVTTTGSGSASAAFNSSNIFSNVAFDSGAGLYSLVTNSGAGTASVTLTDGSIVANRAGQGGTGLGGGLNQVVRASGTGPATATLNGVTVAGNIAPNQGGGINASVENSGGGPVTSPASLVLTSTTVSNNTAHDGGGIFLGESTGQDIGAATAVFSNDTISGNRAVAGGGGGGIEASLGAIGPGPISLSMSSTTISGNSADAGGGGLRARLDGDGAGPVTMTISRSTFSGNTANALNGGGLDIRATTGFFSRVTPAVSVTLTDSTISGNRAPTGAGLSLDLDGQDSLGGRVRATVSGCTISGNSATGLGGGIYAQEQATATGSAMLILVNSTLYGNHADTGGGLYNKNLAPDGAGGVTLLSTTVAFNSATSAGGGLAEVGDQFTVSSTIVAANIAGAGADASGSFQSANFNLIGQTDGSSGWFATDLTGTADNPLDARFDDFGNFGGPTKTLALLEDSPAVGQGSPASPPTDQRGVMRNPFAPSIGAFDFVQPSSFLVEPSVQTVPAGVSFSLRIAARAGDGSFLTGYTGTIHFSSSDGDAILPADYRFTAADRGQHTFTDGVTLQTPGDQTITIKGTGVTATVTIRVTEPSPFDILVSWTNLTPRFPVGTHIPTVATSGSVSSRLEPTVPLPEPGDATSTRTSAGQAELAAANGKVTVMPDGDRGDELFEFAHPAGVVLAR
jgi:hypothetical protein